MNKIWKKEFIKKANGKRRERQKGQWDSRRWKNGVCYLVLFVLCFAGGRLTAARQAVRADNMARTGKLAIVIDDFGYNGEGTAEMLALPIPLTAAIMPFSEFSAENSAAAEAAGKEVIIHMPMESLTGLPEWVGKKGVFCNMSEADIKAAVAEAFDIVPNAQGMNNHMGSAIMEDERCLGFVMDVLQERGCYFVDSMTTGKSKASVLAAERGVPVLLRRVFLDSTDDKEKVKKNLRFAAEVALNEGEAVAIGHVGPEGGSITVEAIHELIAELEGLGIQFVTAGELLEGRG